MSQRIAKKWNFKTEKYTECEIPPGASQYEIDVGKIIQCAACGKKMIYCDGFTSRQIHTHGGFGYIVCDECYQKEWKEWEEAREHER